VLNRAMAALSCVTRAGLSTPGVASPQYG